MNQSWKIPKWTRIDHWPRVRIVWSENGPDQNWSELQSKLACFNFLCRDNIQPCTVYALHANAYIAQTGLCLCSNTYFHKYGLLVGTLMVIGLLFIVVRLMYV